MYYPKQTSYEFPGSVKTSPTTLSSSNSLLGLTQEATWQHGACMECGLGFAELRVFAVLS